MISSRSLAFPLSPPPPLSLSAVAPGNLILFETPPKMPSSALISVHTVGCAWRLLMCYVNTLPKCRHLPPSPSREKRPLRAPVSRTGVGLGVARRARGSRPRRINATSSRALSDAAISRPDVATRAPRKRDSPRRQVLQFKQRNRDGIVAETPARDRAPSRGSGTRERSIIAQSQQPPLLSNRANPDYRD